MDRRDRTLTHSLLCGLIGSGIQRSLSPALQQDEARQHGIRLHYQLIDLDASSRGVAALPTLIEAARLMCFAGLNITYPCKQLVIPLLDALSAEAEAIGRSTPVRIGERLVGHNTDGPGWSWGFRRALPGADLSCVVLLGAGGAGSACADAVLRLGAARLVICDQDAPRAAVLATRLNAHLHGGRASASTDLRAALQGASGLIHATPTGMAATPGMPLPEDWLRRTMWVSEVVYVPLETPLLNARRIGCATPDGATWTWARPSVPSALHRPRRRRTRVDAHFRRLVRDEPPPRRRGVPSPQFPWAWTASSSSSTPQPQARRRAPAADGLRRGGPPPTARSCCRQGGMNVIVNSHDATSGSPALSAMACVRDADTPVSPAVDRRLGDRAPPPPWARIPGIPGVGDSLVYFVPRAISPSGVDFVPLAAADPSRPPSAGLLIQRGR